MKNLKNSLPSGAVVFASKSILVMLMCKKKKQQQKDNHTLTVKANCVLLARAKM